jgi:hypothetical protein
MVLNAVTKSPISRALVTSSDRHMAIMTDDKGRFDFEITNSANRTTSNSSGPPPDDGPFALPKGSAFLLVTKPGYRSAAPTAVPLGDQNALKAELRLQLMPEATLAGSVTASGEDFPSGLSIRLLRRQIQDGRAEWLELQKQEVDARGRYRFGGLAPGEYKVVTEEWIDRIGPLVVTAEKPMTGYPAQAFPGGVSPAAAGVIHVEGGRNIEADLALRNLPYYPVEIPLATIPPATLASALATSDDGTARVLGLNAQTQSVEGTLPDGLYHLIVRINGTKRPDNASEVLEATAELTVAGRPLHAHSVTFLPGTRIAVTVREEYTGPDPNDQAAASAAVSTAVIAPPQDPAPASVPQRPDAAQTPEETDSQSPVDVSLEPEGPGSEVGTLGVFQGRSFLSKSPEGDGWVLGNVHPGRYRVVANAARGYVASLTTNGLDLLREPLMVEPGGANPAIVVVLRDDVGTITVKLPEPAGGQGTTWLPHSVWAYPLGDEGVAAAVQGVQQPDRSFTISNVVPGRYVVLAGEGKYLNLEYRNRDAMKAYESKGVIVEVSAGQNLSVSLKETIADTTWDDTIEVTVD